MNRKYLVRKELGSIPSDEMSVLSYNAANVGTLVNENDLTTSKVSVGSYQPIQDLLNNENSRAVSYRQSFHKGLVLPSPKSGLMLANPIIT